VNKDVYSAALMLEPVTWL